MVITDIYKSCLYPFSDDEVAWVPHCSATEGVHTNVWVMLPNLDKADYYAKVTATEAETWEPRSADSNKGEVIRDDYYYAPKAEDEMYGVELGKVTPAQHYIDGAVRYVGVTIIGAECGWCATHVAALLTASAKVVSTVATSTTTAYGLLVSLFTDMANIPNWLTAGFEIWGRRWTVVHKRWDGEQYVAVERREDKIGSDTIITQGVFEMGYLCYAQKLETDDVITKKYNIHLKGYFSEEYQRGGLAGLVMAEGYDLKQEWIWEKKPYGLKKPKINIPEINR